jgi:hypothetical protein
MRASRARMAMLAAVGACGVLLCACSGLFGSDDSKAGMSCLDDTPQCVEQRQSTLKTMLADKDHGWVKEAATPQAHASGVRLFAFRSMKKDMSCEELAHARKEADSAGKSLHGPESKNLSPAQISRATLFAAEVSKELAAEMKSRRCKA